MNKQLLCIPLWPLRSRSRHSAECTARMSSSAAKGVLKGRAEAPVTKWGDCTGLLLRLSLQARCRLLKITLIIVNCTLNLRLWFSQPASQLWKQLTMSLFFLACDFLANVVFLLLFGYFDHFFSALFGGSFSFTTQICVGVLQHVVSQPPPFFSPYSAFHLCIILCGKTKKVSSLCRWFTGLWYIYLNENVVLLLCHLLIA